MVAFSVANVLQNLVTPIFSALYPKFSQLVASKENVKLVTLYHQGCQLLAVLVLPVAITVVLFAKEILVFWLGDGDAAQNAYQILALLIVGTTMNALMTLPYTLQLAYGWTKLAFYTNAIAVMLLGPLMVWMVGKYQGIGAAWAWIILNMGYFVFLVPIMHRRLLKGEMGKWYRRDIILPILVVVTIGLSVRLAIPDDASKFVTVYGIVTTLALTFAASMLVADHLNIRMLKVNRS
jgi:O-antigen/teichoic acid export membrane protein